MFYKAVFACQPYFVVSKEKKYAKTQLNCIDPSKILKSLI